MIMLEIAIRYKNVSPVKSSSYMAPVYLTKKFYIKLRPRKKFSSSFLHYYSTFNIYITY